MTKAILGIIGGSGVYDLPGLAEFARRAIATPWGEPSDALRFGEIGRPRWSSSPGMGAATGCRPPASITAPISTR